MKNKMHRNLHIFAGCCFVLAFILSLTDNMAFDLRYIFYSIAIVASFANAYIINKKIKK